MGFGGTVALGTEFALFHHSCRPAHRRTEGDVENQRMVPVHDPELRGTWLVAG